MTERDERKPGVRPAGVFRAIVLAAVAAAAPVAGCYESDPGDDAATDADHGAVDDGAADRDDSVARYAVPMYGTP